MNISRDGFVLEKWNSLSDGARLTYCVGLCEQNSQLRAERDACLKRLGENDDEIIGYRSALERLRAHQAEAVRILSAIEFDGQAYEAIQKACELLRPRCDPDDHLYVARVTPKPSKAVCLKCGTEESTKIDSTDDGII